MSLNSFREYRPKIFDEILGQDNIISVLKNQIIYNTYSNAYLFCGERGTGKTTTARVFAKAINCENIENYNPCNKCENCIKSMNNLFEIDAASNNSVEDIRGIIDKIKFAPIFSKFNIFIIDEVHMLSQAAFNALLKTLEEPPKYVIFILITTELNKVPSTIISRCQLYNFRLIDNNDIIKELKRILDNKNIKYDIDSLYTIADKAEGGMRNALSILDSIICFSGTEISNKVVSEILNILDDDIFFDLFNLIKSNRQDLVLLKYNEIYKSGFSNYSFIDSLLNFTLNIYLSKNKSTLGLINKNTSKIEKFENLSKDIDIDVLNKIIRLINKASLEYKLAMNKTMYINILLLNITELINNGKF